MHFFATLHLGCGGGSFKLGLVNRVLKEITKPIILKLILLGFQLENRKILELIRYLKGFGLLIKTGEKIKIPNFKKVPNKKTDILNFPNDEPENQGFRQQYKNRKFENTGLH